MNIKHDIKYGEWTIHHVYSGANGDLYGYHHDAFDGPGDDRCGTVWSVEQAIDEINNYEAEHTDLPAMLREQAV